jgi:predicted ATPase/transcriptional regulator with XRE-family HTH domain
MELAEFREKLHKICQRGGFSQKELAAAIGLHHQVLSRKLNGIRNSVLTQLEVKQIIKTLAGWQAVTTQDQVFELLGLLDLAGAVFTSAEWQTAPLDRLEKSDSPKNDRKLPAGPPKPVPLPRPKTTALALAIPTEPIHNLPASNTPLIGREALMRQVRQMLLKPQVRLVTLLGSGGIGKTRLALYVAKEVLGEFEDGVFFVPLASLTDPQFVPSAILQTLQIKESAKLSTINRLKQYFADKKTLLVLDNFEQLLAASAILDELLAAAPGLKMLVTSQAVLHIYGEHEFNIPPLELPLLAQLPAPARLSGFEAVRLFLERAGEVQPDFALTADNALAVAELCIRLDGLPLAIELAAARLKIMSVYTLLEKLTDQRLAYLTRGAATLPSRQQSLRRTLEWSYSLLDATEQQLFDRLGIFSNGWTVEAAHAICDLEAVSETASLDNLSQLLDKSLVVRVSGPQVEPRFTMLETLREFALERLAWQKEVQVLRERHALYYLRLAEEAEPRLGGGPQQISWLDRLDQERENLRTALQWLLEKAQAIASASELELVGPGSFGPSQLDATRRALEMAAALASYWDNRGYYSEGRHWLVQAIELPAGKDSSAPVRQARAKALNRAGDLAFLQGEYAQARLYLEESLALKRQLADRPGIAAVLNSLGNVAVWQREFDNAVEIVQESLAIRQALNDSKGISQALINLGNIYSMTDEYQKALEVYTESLAISEKLNNKQGQASCLGSLARVFSMIEDYDKAGQLFEEALPLFEELGDKRRIAITLDLLGCVYMNQGKYALAVDFCLRCQELCREIGDRWGVAASLHNLGNIRLRQGQFPEARRLYLENLEAYIELGERYIGDSLDDLAGLAIAQHEYEKAAQLYAVSEKLRARAGSRRESFLQSTYEKQLVKLHNRLDDGSFKSAWSQGAALELGQALTLARSVNYLDAARTAPEEPEKTPA